MGFIQPGVPQRLKRRRTSKWVNGPSALLPKGETDVLHNPKSRNKGTESRPPLESVKRPKISSSKFDNWSPLSRLELLPTELLQNVFLLSHNLSLPVASPALCRFLTGSYLQLQVVRLAYGKEEILSDIISRRFFTWDFLQSVEERYGPLDFHKVVLPSRLLTAPFLPEKIALLRGLQDRGASLDSLDTESQMKGIEQAITGKRVDVVELFSKELGVVVFPGALRLGVKSGFPAENLHLLTTPRDMSLNGCDAWLAVMDIGDYDYRCAVIQALMKISIPTAEFMSVFCKSGLASLDLGTRTEFNR